MNATYGTERARPAEAGYTTPLELGSRRRHDPGRRRPRTALRLSWASQLNPVGIPERIVAAPRLGTATTRTAPQPRTAESGRTSQSTMGFPSCNVLIFINLEVSSLHGQRRGVHFPLRPSLAPGQASIPHEISRSPPERPAISVQSVQNRGITREGRDFRRKLRRSPLRNAPIREPSP